MCRMWSKHVVLLINFDSTKMCECFAVAIRQTECRLGLKQNPSVSHALVNLGKYL